GRLRRRFPTRARQCLALSRRREDSAWTTGVAMRARRSMFAVLVVACAAACGHSVAASALSSMSEVTEDGGPGLSFVITNAHVYTGDVNGADVDAVAIRGSKIASIGKSLDLGARCVAPCSIVDARGGFVVPGFHDAHVHVASAGEQGFELTVGG